jgi:hypothetical protein
MSALHVRLREQEKAQREFEENARELEQDIGLRIPARWLAVRVRLLEKLVEETGGSLVTEHYRVRLSDLKKRVALHAEAKRASLRNLHVVRAS